MIENLNAQAGLFSLIRFEKKIPSHATTLGSRFNYNQCMSEIIKLLHERSTMRILVQLTLPVTEAPKLLRFLREEGVSGASLFPGFDGVARGIHEMEHFDRLTEPLINPDIEL